MRWWALVLSSAVLLSLRSAALAQGTPPPPQITGPFSASGKTGEPFSLRFTATNNPTQYTMRGIWPQGLSADFGAATLTGTPSQIGTFKLSVLAANGPLNAPQWGPPAEVTITITDGSGPPASVITGPFSMTGSVGRPFSVQINATNSPRKWSQSGDTPPGLRIDLLGGSLAGTPTQQGTFRFSLMAENAGANGASQWSSPASFTITINTDPSPPPPPPSTDPDAPKITGPSSVAGQTGQPFSAHVTATNNPTQFAIRSGSLHAGLTLNTTTGAITGTPQVDGTATVTVAAANSGPSGLRWGDPASLRVTISRGPDAVPPVITGPAVGSGTVGKPFSLNFSTTNQPREYAIRSGTLPAGLHMDLMAGTITGTPTQVGTYNLTVAAANAGPDGSVWGPPASLALTIMAGAGAPTGPTTPPPPPPPTTTPAPTGPTAPAMAATRISSISANSTPTIQGMAEPAARVTVYLDGRMLGATTASSQGDWRLDLTGSTPLAKGRYSIHAIAEAGGKTSTSSSSVLEVIGTLPIVASQTITAQMGVALTNAVVSARGDPTPGNFTADALPSGIRLDKDTGAFSGTPNESGTKEIMVSATNAVGQGSGKITFNIAPAATTTPPPSPATGGSGTVTPPPGAGGSTVPPSTTNPPPAGSTPGSTTGGAGSGTPTPGGSGSTTPTPTSPGPGNPPPAPIATVPVAPVSRLANVSARMEVNEAEPSRMFITGFVIDGPADQRVLLRVAGPALGSFGVQGALPNPRLEVRDSTGKLIGANEGAKADDVATVGQSVGAFPLRSEAADAALVMTLSPGVYSMNVLPNGGKGIALAEVFDANASRAGSGLVNLSTRGFVGTGAAQLTTGFVITGDAPKRILVRAAGPTLARFGVEGSLNDSVLIVQQGTTVIAQNDDWEASQAGTISAAAIAAGAFAFPAGSKDSALVIDLPPGVYTATVSGAAGGTGAALLEVYEVARP